MCRMETFRTSGVHLVAVRMTTNRQLPVTQFRAPSYSNIFAPRSRPQRADGPLSACRHLSSSMLSKPASHNFI